MQKSIKKIIRSNLLGSMLGFEPSLIETKFQFLIILLFKTQILFLLLFKNKLLVDFQKSFESLRKKCLNSQKPNFFVKIHKFSFLTLSGQKPSCSKCYFTEKYFPSKLYDFNEILIKSGSTEIEALMIAHISHSSTHTCSYNH
jgi:hypothetical protein